MKSVDCFLSLSRSLSLVLAFAIYYVPLVNSLCQILIQKKMVSFINTPAEKKRVAWQNRGEMLVVRDISDHRHT